MKKCEIDWMSIGIEVVDENKNFEMIQTNQIMQ